MSDDSRTPASVADDAPHAVMRDPLIQRDVDVPPQSEQTHTRSRSSRRQRDADRTVGMRMSALDMAEGGLLADVGIVLDLASIYLPIIGAVLTPTVPTPFAILTLRRGVKVALVSSAVAMFLVTMLAGPHFGWRMGLEASVGILMGWAMRRRWRSLPIITIGTFIVATVTFAAALFVLVATGLPVHDVVQELRNGLRIFASLTAFAAGVVGLHSQWLAIRPGLATFGNEVLRFWPVLMFLYITALALPVVTLYYTIANSAARVLGEDARPFPPRWIARILVWCVRALFWLARMMTNLSLAPFRLIQWVVRTLTPGRRARRQM